MPMLLVRMRVLPGFASVRRIDPATALVVVVFIRIGLGAMMVSRVVAGMILAMMMILILVVATIMGRVMVGVVVVIIVAMVPVIVAVVPVPRVC